MTSGNEKLLIEQKPVHIPYGDKTIEAIVATRKEVCSLPESGPTGGVILTHGAGGDMDTAELPGIASHLAQMGIACARFTCKGLNLKYKIKVYKAVVEYFMNTEKWSWFIIGGRSMGARAAVNTANDFHSEDDEPGKAYIKGVLCLSYPLHPPKDVSKLRDDIIHSCNLPMLFVSGTEDFQCEKALMEKTLRSKTHVSMHWLEGGDHGFRVKGRDKSLTLSEICEVVGGWCKTMGPAATDDVKVQTFGLLSASLNSSGRVKTSQKRGKTTSLHGNTKGKRRKELKD